MSVKTLLVHIDDTAGATRRVEVAARLARDVSARLIGAYLVPTAEITPSVAALIPGDVLARRMNETGRAQDAAETSFRAAASRAGVAAIEWRAPAGDAVEEAVVHGRCCDLMVLGQPNADEPFATFSSKLLNAALLGAGRPILVVPYIGAQASLGKRILVATDGSREASRAIGDAWFLLQRASAVKVLVSMLDDAEAARSFTQASGRLKEWFRDHGIEPEVERYEAETGDHGDWLLSRASDFAASLIVMGGYGHPRLRELVLGGMTRTVLQAMPIPVLMAH